MKTKIVSLLTAIVTDGILHAKWLNTLSYLENCGARKIAACEHPTLVKEEMLKHASEEFRHSHYLKLQIKKVSPLYFPDYSLSFILGGVFSLNYLKKLDVLAARFLIEKMRLEKREIKKFAYFLVTYAIELRAQAFYPLYENILRANRSNIYVKSIILEEQEHLDEMKECLAKLPFGLKYAKHICTLEKVLFNQWIQSVEADL